jgi:hypothetical protein
MPIGKNGLPLTRVVPAGSKVTFEGGSASDENERKMSGMTAFLNTRRQT